MIYSSTDDENPPEKPKKAAKAAADKKKVPTRSHATRLKDPKTVTSTKESTLKMSTRPRRMI
jgi:hypothetical protein